jgi:hypothetical protein
VRHFLSVSAFPNRNDWPRFDGAFSRRISMPGRLEVSGARRLGDQIEGLGGRIEGRGGIWRNRAWCLSLESLIREIDRPHDQRQWEFFIRFDLTDLRLRVVTQNGCKVITTAAGEDILSTLPDLGEFAIC